MIAYCDDPSIIGSEFYVMDKLVGIIPRADLPRGVELHEDDVREMCGT